jgi:hypothetical protein
MDIPEVVATFLRELDALRIPQLGINPLSPEESARQSAQLAKMSLFAKHMGLIVLDDANDSNPFCYVSRGLATGMVLHHDHEGDVLVRFPDLASFGDELRKLAVRGDHIDELRFAPRLRLTDQAALRAELRERLAANDKWTEPFARVFLPLLDPADVETLELAVSADDFYIREAAGHAMARAPLPAHLPLAQRLMADPQAQVRTPARRVLVALKVPLPAPEPDTAYVDDGQRPRTALCVSMLELPDGQVRVVIDDLQRQRTEPPFTWTAQRFEVYVDVNRGSMHDGQPTDPRQLADLGGYVLALLERQLRADGG